MLDLTRREQGSTSLPEQGSMGTGATLYCALTLWRGWLHLRCSLVGAKLTAVKGAKLNPYPGAGLHGSRSIARLLKGRDARP